MNIPSRITALAKPDHIMIGSIKYQKLGSRLEQTPKEFGLKNVEYIHYETGDTYTIILVASNKKLVKMNLHHDNKHSQQPTQQKKEQQIKCNIAFFRLQCRVLV